jgi:hypothetical protein
MRICISRDSKNKDIYFLAHIGFELFYWSDIDILIHDHVCLEYMPRDGDKGGREGAAPPYAHDLL